MKTENDTRVDDAPEKGQMSSVGSGGWLGEIDRLRSDYRFAVGPHLDREDLVKAAECERIVRICTAVIEGVRSAVNAECWCGGRPSGPFACPACMVWHRMTSSSPNVKDEPRRQLA